MLSELHKNALWVIQDPWETMDLVPANDIAIHSVNHYFATKIVQYMKENSVQHIATSSPGHLKIHPQLTKYHRISGESDIVHYYQKIGAQNIVMCGFHNNSCIKRVTDHLGQYVKNKMFNLYVKENLVCTLAKNWRITGTVLNLEYEHKPNYGQDVQVI